jgi:hypothetical protein
MAEITRQELEAISARCEVTTPGPWKASLEGRDHVAGSSCVVTAGEPFDLTGATDQDIEFIAHAKQDIPRLVHELMRLKGWTA